MSFVPAHTVVTAKGAEPGRVVYVLHGILGSGRNWRTMARRFAAARPDTAYVLVDLRCHGKSECPEGPHTVTTAADDLLALHPIVGAPDEIIGHSFGGKVAVRYVQRHPDSLEQAWVLDSRLDADDPGEDNEVLNVIRALAQVPVPLADRQDVVTFLQERGFSEMLARWMTTNLERTPDGFDWAFDLPAVTELIDDYWQLDLWPVLRDPPCRIDIVRAGRSDRWPPDVLRHYQVDVHPRVRLHTLPDAGHWLHVDDPDGLVALLTG